VGNRRANLGFGSELESFKPDEWQTKAKTKTKIKTSLATKAAAEEAGFKSREPSLVVSRRSQRRRTTGRNQQLNIKAKAETIEAFYSIADANGWGLGETLEYAVELLQKKAT
jgi:hypothetical protein